jgi:hypothetical protein
MNCCCCCCTRWVTITLVLTVTTGHTGSSWLFPYHSNFTLHQHLRMIRDLILLASDFVLVLYHRSHVSMSIVSEFVLSTEQLSTFKLLAGSSSLILYYSTSEFHHARFQNTQGSGNLPVPVAAGTFLVRVLVERSEPTKCRDSL